MIYDYIFKKVHSVFKNRCAAGLVIVEKYIYFLLFKIIQIVIRIVRLFAQSLVTDLYLLPNIHRAKIGEKLSISEQLKNWQEKLTCGM